MIADAREIADYVIIDSPPLTDVVDALPLASYVDDVLLVVKLGRTTLSKLSQLGELLVETRNQAGRLHRRRNPASHPLRLSLLRCE